VEKPTLCSYQVAFRYPWFSIGRIRAVPKSNLPPPPYDFAVWLLVEKEVEEDLDGVRVDPDEY
jgi:hypothetical protein